MVALTSIIEHLTVLFNSFMHMEHIPRAAQKGVIITIPKGGKKQILRENNRGITLLPVVYKLFEKIVLYRLKSLIKRGEIVVHHPL